MGLGFAAAVDVRGKLQPQTDAQYAGSAPQHAAGYPFPWVIGSSAQRARAGAPLTSLTHRLATGTAALGRAIKKGKTKPSPTGSLQLHHFEALRPLFDADSDLRSGQACQAGHRGEGAIAAALAVALPYSGAAELGSRTAAMEPQSWFLGGHCIAPAVPLAGAAASDMASQTGIIMPQTLPVTLTGLCDGASPLALEVAARRASISHADSLRAHMPVPVPKPTPLPMSASLGASLEPQMHQMAAAGAAGDRDGDLPGKAQARRASTLKLLSADELRALMGEPGQGVAPMSRCDIAAASASGAAYRTPMQLQPVALSRPLGASERTDATADHYRDDHHDGADGSDLRAIVGAARLPPRAATSSSRRKHAQAAVRANLRTAGTGTGTGIGRAATVGARHAALVAQLEEAKSLYGTMAAPRAASGSRGSSGSLSGRLGAGGPGHGGLQSVHISPHESPLFVTPATSPGDSRLPTPVGNSRERSISPHAGLAASTNGLPHRSGKRGSLSDYGATLAAAAFGMSSGLPAAGAPSSLPASPSQAAAAASAAASGSGYLPGWGAGPAVRPVSSALLAMYSQPPQPHVQGEHEAEPGPGPGHSSLSMARGLRLTPLDTRARRGGGSVQTDSELAGEGEGFLAGESVLSPPASLGLSQSQSQSHFASSPLRAGAPLPPTPANTPAGGSIAASFSRFSNLSPKRSPTASASVAASVAASGVLARALQSPPLLSPWNASGSGPGIGPRLSGVSSDGALLLRLPRTMAAAAAAAAGDAGSVGSGAQGSASPAAAAQASASGLRSPSAARRASITDLASSHAINAHFHAHALAVMETGVSVCT